jgi:hypothetical protein
MLMISRSFERERLRLFQTDQDDMMPVDPNKTLLTDALHSLVNRLSKPDPSLPRAGVLVANVMGVLDALSGDTRRVRIDPAGNRDSLGRRAVARHRRIRLGV